MTVKATYTQAEIDEIIYLLDQQDAIHKQIRDKLAKAALKETHKDSEPYGYKIRLTQADIAAMDIEWYQKGMKPAPDGTAFCFAFATDREGYIRPELQPLVDELNRHDKITIGLFEYKLGGRDNNLISRNKTKKRLD